MGFATVAGAGPLGLLLLRAPPPPATPPPRLSARAHCAAALAGAARAAELLRQPRMLLLLPVFFFSGAELSFWTGEFPQLLANGSMGTVGFVLAWSGVGEVLGGVAMGRLSDAAGRTTSLLLSVALYAAGLALACAMKSGAPLAAPLARGSPVAAYVAAFFFGVADAGFNANAYAMCSQLYGEGGSGGGGGGGGGEGGGEGAEPPEPGAAAAPLLGREGEGAAPLLLSVQEGDGARAQRKAPFNPHASVGAFTVFQLVQNFGSALWYGVSLWLPVHSDASKGLVGSFAQIWLQAALLLLVVVTFARVDFLARKA